jgi:hypothetical protein
MRRCTDLPVGAGPGAPIRPLFFFFSPVVLLDHLLDGDGGSTVLEGVLSRGITPPRFSLEGVVMP